MLPTMQWLKAASSSKNLELLEKAGLALGQLVGTVKGHPLADAWLVRMALRQAVELARLEGILVSEAAVAGHLAHLPLPIKQDHGALMKALRLAKSLLVTVGATWPRLPGVGDDDENTGIWSRSSLVAGLESERGPALLKVAQGLAASFGLLSRGAHVHVPAAFFALGLTPAPYPLIAARMRQAPAAEPREFLSAFLEAVEREAAGALKLLREMQLGHIAIKAKIGPRRTSSHLPAAVDLAMRAPFLSAVMIAGEFGCTTRGASLILDELEKLGVVSEVSGRRAWKTYAIVEFGGLKEDVKRRQRTTFLDATKIPYVPSGLPPASIEIPEGVDELDFYAEISNTKPG